ncbi:MAG: hypothetical protein ACPG31_01125 [Planctomycetota bacterium]
MNRASSLIERAQDLLDQRLDPFEDAALCEALMEDVEALEQITHMRAVHLELAAMRRMEKPRGRQRWGWMGLPAAAALLLWMASDREWGEKDMPVTPTAMHETERQDVAPAAPAILKVREKVRTTAVQQRPQGNLLRVKITTTEHATQT